MSVQTVNRNARVSREAISSIQFRLLSSADRLERLADDRDLPGSTRLTYRDLAGKCRAEADSLAVLQ